MKTVYNMTKLDLYTLKSQVASYVVIPMITAIFFYIGSTMELLGFSVAWMIILINGNLFAVQEKYSLERLYCTLAVKQKDYIRGRYFSTTINLLIAFLIMLISAIFLASVSGHHIQITSIINSFFISLCSFSSVSSIQYPIYFYAGYTKGRFYSMIPFLILLGTAMLSTFNNKLINFIMNIRPLYINILCFLISLLLMTASYFVTTKLIKYRN